MKLQKITAAAGGDYKVIWVGSQAEAASTRKQLVSDGFKRAELTTEEVDVPTDKVGLIKFLNSMGD